MHLLKHFHMCIRTMAKRFFLTLAIRFTHHVWKYVNVRRLSLFIEESIEEATQWVVFEPNNERLCS